MSRLTIISAIARNGVIGKNNTLPWHLPADMAFFKKTTTDHTIVMGRKNYEDIGRALPNRRNIVLSRDAKFTANGCEVVGSFANMLENTRHDEEVFIIGGAAIYDIALEHTDRLLITKIAADIDGDIYFPDIDWSNWHEVSNEEHKPDESNEFGFSVVEYVRKGVTG